MIRRFVRTIMLYCAVGAIIVEEISAQTTDDLQQLIINGRVQFELGDFQTAEELLSLALKLEVLFF